MKFSDMKLDCSQVRYTPGNENYEVIDGKRISIDKIRKVGEIENPLLIRKRFGDKSHIPNYGYEGKKVDIQRYESLDCDHFILGYVIPKELINLKPTHILLLYKEYVNGSLQDKLQNHLNTIPKEYIRNNLNQLNRRMLSLIALEKKMGNVISAEIYRTQGDIDRLEYNLISPCEKFITGCEKLHSLVSQFNTQNSMAESSYTGNEQLYQKYMLWYKLAKISHGNIPKTLELQGSKDDIHYRSQVMSPIEKFEYRDNY